VRATVALALAIAMAPLAGAAGPVRRATGRLAPNTAFLWTRATFSDVPFDFWAWRWVESIAAAGLTSGCTSTPFPRYCPDATVDQSEIAVLLLKAKEGRGYQPPSATGTVFTDVPLDHWAAPWIEELARRGITSGCGGGRYCPSAPVTRDQIAVLLLRSVEPWGWSPPAATGTVFADVSAGSWAAGWIEELARRGVATGCGGGLYCPAAPLARDELAVLLVRTFDLPLVHPPNSPTIGPCLLLPASSIWNTRVDALPVHPDSATWIATIGASTGLHADFGSGLWDGGPIGIPSAQVPGDQPPVAVTFDYDDESDPGPYPIPPGVAIEGGPDSDGDRHVLVLDVDRCRLFELWAAWPQEDGSWHAGSGAVFDLTSNALRPAGWTSSDAAGLPVLPGLVRYDEVASGEIRHAIRFTARLTRRTWVWPARHYASSSTDPGRPAMGQRFRLKASFDVSSYPPRLQVILTALQRYGLILADNGSDWYLSGQPDERWDNDVLRALSAVTGRDFEAVDSTVLQLDPDSGEAAPPP
jgi:hypothetical protein